MIGIAHADFQGLELGLGDQLGLGRHPIETIDACRKSRQEVVHHGFDAFFLLGARSIYLA